MSAASTLLYGGHVNANGIRQHYIRYGDSGRPLIILPGIISPAATWGFVGDRLGQHFAVYILDARGRGLSEAGAHLDYGLDTCSNDVLAFAESLGMKDYIVLGHSMGARTATRAASKTPPNLSRTILIDPPVSGPGRRAYPTPLKSYLDVLRAAKSGDVYTLLRSQARPLWPESLLRLRAEWVHTCDERAVMEAYRSFHQDDFHVDFARVTAPIALIAADTGGVILPEEEDELRTLVPNLFVARVAGAGHQLHVDKPESFFGILGAILEKQI